MYAIFDGDVKDLNRLRKYVFSKPYEIKTIVEYGGIREIEGERVYIEGNKCLVNGAISDKYICKKDSIKGCLLDHKPITKEQVDEIKYRLLKYYDPLFCYQVLGYTVAQYFSPLLRQQDIKTPNFIVVGESGSGKTTITESVIIPLIGLKSDLVDAKGNTATGLRLAGGCNTTIPLVLDDFKPTQKDMTKSAIAAINSILNTAYDRTSSLKGTITLNTREYAVRTSVVLTGERLPDQASTIERSVVAMLSKEKLETVKQVRPEIIYDMQDKKDILRSFSRTILDNVMKQDAKELSESYKQIRNSIRTRVALPRVMEGIAFTLLGLVAANSILGTIDLERAKELLIDNANKMAKLGALTEVERSLQAMDSYLSVNGIFDNEGYELTRIDGNGNLCVRIKEIWELLERNKKDGMMDKGQFIEQLKNSKYISKTAKNPYTNVKFFKDDEKKTSKGIRCYKLNLFEVKQLDAPTLAREVLVEEQEEELQAIQIELES